MKTCIGLSLLLAFLAGSNATEPAPAAPPQPAVTATTPDATALLQRSMVLLREQDRLLRQQRLFLQQPPPPPPPEPPQWLLPLLIATAASSLLGAALQPLLFRWLRAALRPLATSAAIEEIDSKIDFRVRLIGEKVQQAGTDIAEKIDGAGDRLTCDLREGLSRLTQTIEERATPSGATAGDSVRLEHQVLAEHWKQFRDKEKLSIASEAWEHLLAELTVVVPAELQPSFEAVMSPYREHRMLIQRIGIIPKVVNGEMRLPSEAAELKRARELTQLLIATQSTDGNHRLHFPFQSWATDTFLPFADLYLQSYQKAHLEGRDTDLRKGMSLVRQILRLASVEPIDVTLGETRFDSARHIGRATSSDPHVPDGVITGVIRNGFVESGHQVIRQPEVIVNRVR